MSPLTSGQTVGRYRILRPLGAGAMGEVYLAEDPRIERQVAIKTVRLEGAGRELEERRRRLLREGKAAGRLLHPHVVTLFDVGEEGDLLYLAFEYVPGQDLARHLEAGPPLTLGESLALIRQAAEGLDYAHRQGIVHRDIKPGNLLLTEAGGIKISDFGIAKLLGGQGSELTRTGSVMGSPQYLSPEQVRGEALDGRSDLFSLGAVLYELLTGERLFGGETLTAVIYQILHREPPPLAALSPSLGGPVEEVVSRLLAKDREGRFRSAGELARAIAGLEAELPAAALAAVPGADDATRVIPEAPPAVPPSPGAPPLVAVPGSSGAPGPGTPPPFSGSAPAAAAPPGGAPPPLPSVPDAAASAPPPPPAEGSRSATGPAASPQPLTAPTVGPIAGSGPPPLGASGQARRRASGAGARWWIALGLPVVVALAVGVYLWQSGSWDPFPGRASDASPGSSDADGSGLERAAGEKPEEGPEKTLKAPPAALRLPAEQPEPSPSLRGAGAPSEAAAGSPGGAAGSGGLGSPGGTSPSGGSGPAAATPAGAASASPPDSPGSTERPTGSGATSAGQAQAPASSSPRSTPPASSPASRPAAPRDSAGKAPGPEPAADGGTPGPGSGSSSPGAEPAGRNTPADPSTPPAGSGSTGPGPSTGGSLEPAPPPRSGTPSPEPRPDRVLETGMRLTFQADPQDAFVLVDGTVIGRADEVNRDGGYPLPSAGEHLVVLRKAGRRDVRLLVRAAPGRAAPTVIPVHLEHPPAAELAIEDLQRFRVREGVVLRLEPRDTRVAVDGESAGTAAEFSGRGRGMLRLSRGLHRLSFTAPGHRRVDVAVEVGSGASEDHEVIRLELPREQG